MKKALAVFSLVLITSSLYSQWLEMPVFLSESVWASSSLSETIRGQKITYGPEALFDKDTASPWVEGVSGSGIGESVTILTNRPIKGFSLINGFAGSPSLFEKNNRIKELDLSLLLGFTAPGLVSELDSTLYFLKKIDVGLPVTVKDSALFQNFDFPLSVDEQVVLYRQVLQDFVSDNPMLFRMMLDETGFTDENYNDYENFNLLLELYGFLALQITIRDVYPGSRYNDTCLSELNLSLDEF